MCDTYFFMIPIFMSILILYHLHKMWVKMLNLCALHFQRTSMNYKHQKKGVFIYQSINLTYMHCIALFHNNKIIYLRVPCFFFPDCNKSSCNILIVISTVLLTSLISRIFILFFLYNLAYRYFVCVCVCWEIPLKQNRKYKKNSIYCLIKNLLFVWDGISLFCLLSMFSFFYALYFGLFDFVSYFFYWSSLNFSQYFLLIIFRTFHKKNRNPYISI